MWRRLDDWAKGHNTYAGAVAAVLAFPALGGLLFGFDIGATALVVLALQDPAAAGVAWGERIEESTLLRGLFTSSVVGGALVGTLIVLFGAADALGRRQELLVAAGLYGVGGLLEFASGVKAWDQQGGLLLALIARWIYGCGIGFAMHAAPAYLGEMTAPSLRGTVVALKEAAIVLGILLGQVAGLALRHVEGGWKWCYFITAPLTLVMAAGMYALPPSCRWLGLQGRWEEAEDALRFFLRSGVGACVEEIKASCGAEDTRATLLEENAPAAVARRGGWRQLAAALLGRRYRWPLIVGLGVVTFQQISGQPSVLYYTGEVLNDVGLADSATLGVGAFKLVATMLSVVTVERFGRRRLLLVGTAMMLAALCALAVSFHFYDTGADDSASNSNSGALDAAIIVGFFIYIGGYQVGFGPVAWILVAEAFPLEVRSETVALAVCTNFLWNLLVTLFFDGLREALGTSGTFALFAVICAAALLFIFALVPETKGLSLEDVEKLFASGAATTSTSSTNISLASLFSCRRAAGAAPTTAPPYPLPRPRSMSQQGSNGNTLAGFIESLLPVEKTSDSATASPYASMAGARATMTTPATASAGTTLWSSISSSSGVGDVGEGGPEHDGGSPTAKRQHKITLSV